MLDENPDLISGSFQEEDQHEFTLRPQNFGEYIGQNDLKSNLQIFINSAKKRKEALDHVLLHGPPGLGKTTLANIIAKELNCSFRSTSGPVIEKQGDLAAILTSLEPNHVLFIDEIHRMNRVIEEVLYSAMEDYSLDIMIGQGPSATKAGAWPSASVWPTALAQPPFAGWSPVPQRLSRVSRPAGTARGPRPGRLGTS